MYVHEGNIYLGKKVNETMALTAQGQQILLSEVPQHTPSCLASDA